MINFLEFFGEIFLMSMTVFLPVDITAIMEKVIF